MVMSTKTIVLLRVSAIVGGIAGEGSPVVRHQLLRTLGSRSRRCMALVGWLVGSIVCAFVLASGAAAGGANNPFVRSRPVALVETATVYTLSVALAGSGSGTVTSSPAGVDCGSTCSYDFPSGTEVILTATAAP